MTDPVAALGVLAIIVGLFLGLGWLVFGSLANLRQAIVICFTEESPDA